VAVQAIRRYEVTTREAAHCQPGTYRCPTCGATYTALGHETALLCDGGGRHHMTQMQPVTDAESHEKRTA
jgi:hypothetical protein